MTGSIQSRATSTTSRRAIGFAWTPLQNSKRTLFRGGVGLYFDQNHNNVTTLSFSTTSSSTELWSMNANSPLLNPFWPDIARAKSFLADALARNTFRTCRYSATSPPAPTMWIMTSDSGSGQMSAGVAHEFRRWFNASADAVFTRGVHLYIIRNTNLDPKRSSDQSQLQLDQLIRKRRELAYKALQLQANIIPHAGTS